MEIKTFSVVCLESGGNQLFIAVTNLLLLEAAALIAAAEDKTVCWIYDQIPIHQITQVSCKELKGRELLLSV